MKLGSDLQNDLKSTWKLKPSTLLTICLKKQLASLKNEKHLQQW